MNVKEGMRRLAMLVGVLGASFGCFASYVVLRDALAAQARYAAFERLATSDVVQQERKILRAPPKTLPADFFDKQQRTEIKSVLDKSGASKEVKAQGWEAFYSSRTKENFKANFDKILLPEETKAVLWDIKFSAPTADDPYAAIAYTQESTVNQGGIKTIHWTSAEYGVESIETEDGATLYPTPAPTRWPYLLAAIFPVLGFVIPWASVRALAWVGVGFFEKI